MNVFESVVLTNRNTFYGLIHFSENGFLGFVGLRHSSFLKVYNYKSKELSKKILVDHYGYGPNAHLDYLLSHVTCLKVCETLLNEIEGVE